MPSNNLSAVRNGFIKKLSLAIIGIFFLIYIAPLGVAPIAIPDETRYAEIPREMISSGDWIVPHLNGLRYFEKPVMGYWLNALSIMAFGENGFAVRCPSAISTGITALILFFLAKRYSGGYLSGIIVASVFLTFLEVFAVGSFSVLDAPFSLFITSAMVFYFFAAMEIYPLKKNLFLVLSGISCGLAFLTKGFLAFLLPLIIIVLFMVWERRIKDLLKSIWIPALFAFLVVLPWAVLIHIHEPDFWNFFFWNEHIRRFMSDHAQHTQSFLYFFRLFPLAVIPWVFLIPAALLGLGKKIFKESIMRFALCWFMFPFLFFSLSSGKVLTYILPCFPPFALILTTGLNSYLNTIRQKAFNAGAMLFISLICLLVITLLVFQVKGYYGLKPFSGVWKPSLLTAGLLSWAICVLLSIRVLDNNKKIMLYSAAPLLFMFAAHFCIPDLTILHKMPGDFLLQHHDKIRQDTIIVSDKAMASSVCWFYRRSNIYLIGNEGEFAYGLNYKDSKDRYMNPDQFMDFFLKHKRARPVTVIAKAKNYKSWKDKIPEPLFKDSNGEGGFIFAQF